MVNLISRNLKKLQSRSTKIAIAVVTLGLGLSVQAAEKYLEVENFDSIEIGTGIIGTVTCGNSNTITLTGDEDELDRIKVSVHSGELDISRKSSAGSFLNNVFGDNKRKSIRAAIVTTSQQGALSASTGASLTVPDCAVNEDSLDIDLGTGASITVSGRTGKLKLDLSTGSEFNAKAETFKADEAMVDLSTGAMANLCGVSVIEGDASTGATIYVGESVNRSNVDLSTGASVSSRGCR